MAYTASSKKTKVTSGIFANQPVDGSRVSMEYGNSMLSQDATGTPVTSPQTNMSGTGVALVVPLNAVQFTINSTVTTQVGEDSSYAQGVNIPANTLVTFDVANQNNIYIKPSSGTNTVSFYFKVV